MRGDRAMLGLHGAGVMIAVAAALVWPRPGQAALMVPVGDSGMRGVVAWADGEDATLLALDTTNGRAIARITDNRSIVRAIKAGILPIAARAPGCVQP